MPVSALGIAGPQSPDRGVSAMVVATLLFLLGGGARRRRPVALALTLIALVFAFESGVHSVHHLGSPSEAADCAVAVVVAHCPGVTGEAAAALAAPLRGPNDAVRDSGEAPTSGAQRVFHSRAPPVSFLARV